MSIWRQKAVIVGFALAIVGYGTPAFAQGSDPFASAKKLASGGKHAAAISALSGTLNAGTLSPDNTARGFFLRGLSYSKSGKNPQAISDLTNALWLTGLSPTERANAYRARAAAYTASGFKRKAAADLKKAQGGVATPATTVATATPTKPVAIKKPVAAQVAAAAVPKAKIPRPVTPTGDNWTAQTDSIANAAKAKAKAAPAAPGSGSALSSFFGNLFSGGSSSTPSTGQTKTAAAVLPKPVAPAVSKPAKATTAVSAWSSDVSAVSAPAKPKPAVRPAKKQQVAAVNWSTNVASSPKPAAKPKPVTKKKVAKRKAVKKGRFNVQVATVRDRAAAEQIRAAVAKQAPKALNGLTPSIDTAVLGHMGTFFRVRVDGLPTQKASSTLCRTLAKQGHDCFLLAQ